MRKLKVLAAVLVLMGVVAQEASAAIFEFSLIHEADPDNASELIKYHFGGPFNSKIDYREIEKMVLEKSHKNKLEQISLSVLTDEVVEKKVALKPGHSISKMGWLYSSGNENPIKIKENPYYDKHIIIIVNAPTTSKSTEPLPYPQASPTPYFPHAQQPSSSSTSFYSGTQPTSSGIYTAPSPSYSEDHKEILVFTRLHTTNILEAAKKSSNPKELAIELSKISKGYIEFLSRWAMPQEATQTTFTSPAKPTSFQPHQRQSKPQKQRLGAFGQPIEHYDSDSDSKYEEKWRDRGVILQKDPFKQFYQEQGWQFD